MGKKKKKSNVLSTQMANMGCKLVNNMEQLDGTYIISTGVLPLDLVITDKGGMQPKKIYEIYGPEGCGKTTLALSIAQQAIKQGHEPHYFNVERAINSSILNIFGLSPKSEENPEGNISIYNSTGGGDHILDGVLTLLKMKEKIVVIVDSIANLMPKELYDKQVGEASYKSVSNLLSRFLPMARELVDDSESILILLNQQRDNLSGYGKASREPGGRSLKHNTDIRVELRRKQFIKDSNEKNIGHIINATIIKTRLIVPWEAAFHLMYGKGFDLGRDLCELAFELGLIEKNGSWVTLPNGEKAQGMGNVAEKIMEDKELQKTIIEQVKALTL
jgi:recombination protein RecA